ncbi:hypothetical protein Aduo_008153 [Ancylostoma duodenale]
MPQMRRSVPTDLRYVHGCSEDVIREVECAAKKARNHDKEELNCHVCGKSYFSQGGLRKHIRMVHKGEEETLISTGTDPRGEHSVACPECAQGSHSNFELAVHYEKDHNNGTSNFGILETKFSSWVDFETTRICFVTVRDISNFAARHGLIDGRSCADDRAPLRALVEEEENIGAVKLIVTAILSGDGFLLTFVTHNGKKYLERYGNQGLVFDETFNVTRYSFRLASLVVIDDGGNGFPFKGCVSKFDPKYVITDDTYVFYNAFKEVFPLSRAIKILCSFHVSQTLQRKHKEYLELHSTTRMSSMLLHKFDD